MTGSSVVLAYLTKEIKQANVSDWAMSVILRSRFTFQTRSLVFTHALQRLPSFYKFSSVNLWKVANSRSFDFLSILTSSLSWFGDQNDNRSLFMIMFTETYEIHSPFKLNPSSQHGFVFHERSFRIQAPSHAIVITLRFQMAAILDLYMCYLGFLRFSQSLRENRKTEPKEQQQNAILMKVKYSNF